MYIRVVDVVGEGLGWLARGELGREVFLDLRLAKKLD